jgi:hypothetical protein
VGARFKDVLDSHAGDAPWEEELRGLRGSLVDDSQRWRD